MRSSASRRQQAQRPATSRRPANVQQHPTPPHYHVFQLGSLGGSASSGNTINNLGWAMGSSNLTGNASEHATLWVFGLPIDLGTLGGPNGFATGVNNLNQIVGWAENTVHDSTCTPPANFPVEAVIYGPRKDQIQPLPPLPPDPDSAATAINDLGQVVGISGIC